MNIENLKILELGEFALFKRTLPQQTTLVFTGMNRRSVAGVEHRAFRPTLLPWLITALRRGEHDLVVCYAPENPLWDRRAPLPQNLQRLLVRLLKIRSLGTYVLRIPTRIPKAVLDCNDACVIRAHNFPLLERCTCFFKRELPVDFSKACVNSVAAYRTPRDVVGSPFFKRHAGKLKPISPGLPPEIVAMAESLRREKTTDIFFAGVSSHSTIRARGMEQLRSLQSEGYRVDVSEGGLSKADYLERCSRAWLTWSPEGYGWDCFRHVESCLCRSVPVISQPTIYRYKPLLNGVHCFHYDVEDDGLRRA